MADGWFDDPIGLSARAYILVPPIALGKSLLARSHLIPWIKLLPDPQAYALSPHCHGHGIFRTIFFELFSFLHVHVPYPPFRLLTNLGKHQDKTNADIRMADSNGTQRQNRDTVINCPGTPPSIWTLPPSRPPQPEQE